MIQLELRGNKIQQLLGCVHLSQDLRYDHSSKWVGIEGGLPLFCLEKRDPPTLSSEALLRKKITKNVRKRVKIAKNAKSRRKELKIGPKGSFERFSSVFRPYKYKKGSKDTILYNFTPSFLSPWPKNG
jgi:hypothetical protein